MMDEQMSLFAGEPALGSFAPRSGLPLTFQQAREKVGELVLLNESTESIPIWVVVRVTGTSLDPDSHETIINLTDGKRKKNLRRSAWQSKRPIPIYALPKEEAGA